MRTSGPAPSPVLTSVGYLLIKAGAHVGRRFDAVLAEQGLTGREFMVLTHVGEEEALSQQELSHRLGLDPTTVVGLVDRLEDRALLSRTRDRADRRRYVLALTADGRKVLRKAAVAAGQAEAEVLAPLSAAEQAAVRAHLVAVLCDHVPWLD